MKDFLERQFWRFAKLLLLRGYGYCDQRDGEAFMSEGRCGACNASDVQDFIKKHIELLNL